MITIWPAVKSAIFAYVAMPWSILVARRMAQMKQVEAMWQQVSRLLDGI